MTACEIGLGKSFDLGQCLSSAFLGWVPDWAWVLAPYWPWLAGAVVLGLAYRLAGPAGLAAVAGAIGFVLGRRSRDEPDFETGEPEPPPRPKKRKTIF